MSGASSRVIRKAALSKKIALVATFSAVGVVMAPFFWFPFLGTKAYPAQHLINSVAGAYIGPWWASLAATIIGIIRNAMGVGTIFAFPGGIPGAIVVGLTYRITSRFRSIHIRNMAALFEPIGTVFIGGPLALFVVSPLAADYILPAKSLLASIQQYGAMGALFMLWSGWAVSSVIGCAIGYVLLLLLERFGLKP